eukprot:c4720_g1_i1.p1 GENE.c4720_g1_i1~~c4720_g1_i1.p1  ORF type:complete len:160 (-),score=39.02 c4720_g1_i1:64-543(-)
MVGFTSELRACLPSAVSRQEAVFNISRAAFLINSLWKGVLGDLRYGTQDAIHQPQRAAKVYSHLNPIIDAALSAGAHGAFLSGAGPTVLAITSGAAGDSFTQQHAERGDIAVANAMRTAAVKCGTVGEVFITRPSDRGAHIVFVDPPFSDGLLHYAGDV